MKKKTTITIHGGALSVTKKTSDQQRAAQSKARRKPRTDQKGASYGDRNKGCISRSIRRTQCSFVKKVQAIENRPTVHLSIVMPDRLRTPKLEARVLNSCLTDFFAEASKQFPKAYFIYFFGWTREAGFHAHVLMRFGEPGSAKKKAELLPGLWAGIVESDKQNLFHPEKYYHPATLGYLTTPEKFDEMAAAVHKLGGKRLWGVVNSKNIAFYDPLTFELTPSAYEDFLVILEDLLREAGAPQSTYRQLEKEDFCCAYLTRELLLEAYEQLMKVWGDV